MKYHRQRRKEYVENYPCLQQDDNLGGNDNDDDCLSDFSDDNSDGQCGA